MNQAFTSFQEFKRRYPIRPTDAGTLLGSGSYGRVVKVEDQLETEWVAIKISEFKGNDTRSLRAEVKLAQRVPRQANIARYDACYRLETDTSVSDFAIMKYYPDGNLADLLRRETLTSAQIDDIARGILLGLQHLHRHRIVHRDFKPANILISRDNAGRFIPKIADFGLSKVVSDDELDSSDFDLSDGRGTPSYKAPEQIEGSRVSFNLDLWAFGVILYEILTGEKPFRSDLKNSSEQAVRRVVERKIMTVELPNRLSQIAEPYATIIRRCLVRDIHERVRKEDELLDLLDQVPQLMTRANALLDNRQFTEALSLFEQVLVKREHHTEAQQGVEECREALDKLNPKLVAVESELTDAYQEDKTDVYVVPSVLAVANNEPKRTAIGEQAVVKPASIKPDLQRESRPRLFVQLLGKEQRFRKFPWRVVAPTAIVISGLVWYFAAQDSGSVSTLPQTPTEQQASIVAPIGPKVDTHEPGIEAIPNETKDALTKRIDNALNRARQAYRKQDYKTALILTNSALQLDPTRQDVAKLRDAARTESKRQAPTDSASSSALTTAEPTNAVGPPMTVEAKAEEPVPVNVKQEAQETYDQLIEEGLKAITTSNNKVKAISAFSKAQVLAKEQDLNMAKADGAYTYTMNKGKGYFDRDEFEGAKAWFEVARSLKDTDEVRRKIKQCSN